MSSIATPGCGCGGGETQPPDEFNPTLIQQGGAVGSTSVATAASTIPPHVTYAYEHGATSPQQEAMLRVVKGSTAQSAANNMLGGADTGMGGGIPVPQVHTPVPDSGPNNSNTISASTNATGVQAAANRALDACIGQGPECTGQVAGTSQDGGRKRGKSRRTHRRRHHIQRTQHRRHHTARKHSGGKRHHKKMSHKVRHTRSKYTRSRKH